MEEIMRRRYSPSILLAIVFGLLLQGTGMAHSDTESPDSSRLDVGDWVVYRYHGTLVPEPITLSEWVVARSGQQITIRVRWHQSGREREWEMLLTDTPQNRAKNRTDRLFAIEANGLRELPNNDAELLRLFEGTYAIPETPLQRISTDCVHVTLCGVEHQCNITTSLTRVAGREAYWRDRQCPRFPWQDAGVEITSLRDGTVLLASHVAACGRRM